MSLRFFAGLLLVVVAVGVFLWMRSGTISGAEARRLVEGGARLIDVRTPEEYAAGHIEGAVNIPLQELAGRTSEIGSKETAVILYCRSGNRSRQAMAILKKAHFTTLHDLGAMSRW